MSASLLVEERDEVLLGTAALVIFGFLRTLGKELDCGVGLDVVGSRDGLGVSGLGVDLRDGDVLFKSEVGSDLLPDGSEVLAVYTDNTLAADPYRRQMRGARKLTSTPRRSKCHQDIRLAQLFRERTIRQQNNITRRLNRLLDLRAGLLLHELGQALEITAAVVVYGLVADAIKPLQCRESLDLEALSEVLVGVGVDLGDVDVAALEGGAELLVDRSEALAVTAPWGEELDERGLARLEDYFIEVLGKEVENVRGGDGAEEEGQGGGEDVGEGNHGCGC